MLLPHNKVSGGVQDSQIMIPSFFDRFYVMPPLTNGVHYRLCIHILPDAFICIMMQVLGGTSLAILGSVRLFIKNELYLPLSAGFHNEN